ncbi:hypothetical protein BN2497_14423 [Janthinobacterium sp. CG23_2]|nr:hypothetical protein BN2497_14423 [Janthinobacterium sp. CG23_2]CUU33609.1 hypothetical protein BN3177_14423 [Janthinobacterium sp. CG23_2]
MEFTNILRAEIDEFHTPPVIASKGAQGHREHEIRFATAKRISPTPEKIKQWANSIYIRHIDVTMRNVT